ncbi:MAG TPA: SRPBCC family protein [Candidatus Krumholzibacteria bacterium]|nr:SRPBCC family protein [Candidatus Krumholzibacteria bacterium]
MHVTNIHHRDLPAPPTQIGALLDTLASPQDGLWPRRLWPRMAFDRPLGVGADGGHGPIRYFVEAYEAGRSIRFRFTGPRGFDGIHRFDVEPRDDGTTRLRHTIEMETRGRAVLTWPLLYEPMHDALIEDAFTTAEGSLGAPLVVRPWSWRVKVLRWVVSGGRSRRQQF